MDKDRIQLCVSVARIKRLAVFLAMVLLLDCALPLLASQPARAGTVDQFNINLSPINSYWAVSGASQSGSQFNFASAEGEASVVLQLQDNDLLAAIDLGNVTLSSSAQLAVANVGDQTENASATGILSVHFGASVSAAVNAAAAASDSHTSTQAETSQLAVDGVSVPVGTRWLLVSLNVIISDTEALSASISNVSSIIGDTTAPTLTADYDSDWTNEAVSVTVTADDAVGVKAIYNGDDILVATGSSYTFSVSSEGSNSYTFYAQDYAGNNSSELSFTVSNYDATAPSDIVMPGYATDWVSEDGSVTVDVTGNDSDIDSDTVLNLNTAERNNGTLRVTAVSASPTNGTAVVTTDNKIKYTPRANWYGTDSFEYTIANSDGNTATATVLVTVEEVNDVPVAGPDSATTAEDTPVTFQIFANDSDVDTDNSGAEQDTIYIVPNSFNGLFTDGTLSSTVEYASNTGLLTYTPAANFNGVDVFSYLLTDGEATATGYVTVTVTPVNDMPEATDTSLNMNEDGPAMQVDIAALATDADLARGEDETLTFVITGASDATSTDFNAQTNCLTYTPKANWNGTYTVNYKVTDNSGAFDTGTITIEVAQVNDAPVAVTDEAQTLQDEAVQLPLMANDYDVDMDETLNATTTGLTITFVEGSISGNEASSTAIYEQDSDMLTYTPAAGFYGTDTFTYRITDGTATAEGTVEITVIAADYTIAASPSTLSFGSVAADYATPSDYQTITISNLGNKPVTIQSLSLDDFEIDAALPLTILALNSAVVRIKPNAALAVGTYERTLTITTAEGTSAQADVAFTVNDQYTITAAAGSGGTISPEGGVFDTGSDVTFAITASNGYRIASVKVDGVSIGAVNQYTFEDLAATHTIEASFARRASEAEPTPSPTPGRTSRPHTTHTPSATETPDETPYVTAEAEGEGIPPAVTDAQAPMETDGSTAASGAPAEEAKACFWHWLTALAGVLALLCLLLLRKRGIALRIAAFVALSLLMLLFALRGFCRLDWPFFMVTELLLLLVLLMPGHRADDADAKK